MESRTFPKFGDQTPFAEPYWYQGFATPYYTQDHYNYRNLVRSWLDKEIRPNIDKWMKTGYPYQEVHTSGYKAGVLGKIFSEKYGGGMPEGKHDFFYELILFDEISAMGKGSVLGQLLINLLGMPLIERFGNEYVKNKVLRGTVKGEKACSLAISEPYAGSDVAQIRTVAVKDGDYYVVSGSKKWITGGMMADYFVTAVRTGKEGSGMGGISLLLIDANLPGFKRRKMETQMDDAHNTTFLTFNKVRVHKDNLIGKENNGFKCIVHNFNHERWLVAVDGNRKARVCYQEAFNYAMSRKTFGKTLNSHQIIRYKLAEMARQIEANQSIIENVAFQFNNVEDRLLGAQCCLLKVQASKTFEYCAREASQIFGGSSIVKEGRGQIVEALNRQTRALSIYAGSEEIMLDFAIRSSIQAAQKLGKSQKL